MRITSETRDSLFETVKLAQSLHFMVCTLLVVPSEELEQQTLIELEHLKAIVREL